MLEVNPRASRTVPFVAKAIGEPIAKIAARIMAGETPRRAFGLMREATLDRISRVKEAVFPFARFPGVDMLLGPEMRSTGEVMGLDRDFALAFAKSQLGAGVERAALRHAVRLGARRRQAAHPAGGQAAGRTSASRCWRPAARSASSPRTASPPSKINKVLEGRPHIVDAIRNGQVQLVFNTTEGPRRLLGLADRCAAPP